MRVHVSDLHIVVWGFEQQKFAAQFRYKPTKAKVILGKWYSSSTGSGSVWWRMRQVLSSRTPWSTELIVLEQPGLHRETLSLNK